jgi:TQXA domain-containing protein/LPXTG-motif cell wall-anchored protein
LLSALREVSRARLTTTFTAAVAAAAVLAFAAPANADPVRGTYVGHHPGTDSKVQMKKGSNNRELSTSLLQLKVDGTGEILLTYCIDINTRVRKVAYAEKGWGETSLGDNAKYVNWILHHSVPFLSAEDLASAAGLPSAPSMSDAVAGTQAAIWHFSDGYDLRVGNNKATVETIYTYLTGDQNTGMDNEPAPTLSLSPENASGEPGDLLGPIEVSTSAERVDVSLADAPDGAKLLGPDKETEVTTAENGDKLYVKVPKGTADGSAKVNADVTARVSPGRVFKADVESQILILADSDEVKVHDETVVTWAHTPKPAPGSSSEEVCKPKAGVKLSLVNEGDAPADFTVSYGETTENVTVKGGEIATKVIPVAEDTAYKITVKSGQYEKIHQGMLNCEKDEVPPSPTPTPSGGGGGDLPKTGVGGLATILGVGFALLLVGAAMLFVVRRRGRHAAY